MKWITVIFTALLLLPAPLRAELKLPADVYRTADLDKAMDEAVKKKKPLFIVYGNSEPGDKEETETQLDTLKAGKTWAITVFAGSKEVLSLPPLVIMGAQESGTSPTVIIASPEGDKVWKVIAQQTVKPRAEMKDHVEAGIKACKADITKWFAAQPPHGPVPPGDRDLAWKKTDQESVSIGIFGKVQNGSLYFRGSADELPDIPVAKLTPAAQRYLRYITGAGPAAPAVEKWTNAQGKVLEAAFLSLEDGKVTLRTAAGTEHTLALNTLSAGSQKRAKELAAAGVKKQ